MLVSSRGLTCAPSHSITLASKAGSLLSAFQSYALLVDDVCERDAERDSESGCVCTPGSVWLAVAAATSAQFGSGCSLTPEAYQA